MKNDSSVLGYVMARDEWPLLGAAISHALEMGVDHVLVLDHASKDGTAKGLLELQHSLGDRISILKMSIPGYFQEAATRAVLSSEHSRSFDWIYVFDADEFLLIPSDTSLKKILSETPSEIVALRYQIDQWVSPVNINLDRLSDLELIIDKSIPEENLPLPGSQLNDRITRGTLNFFDVPFPSKLIIRSDYAQKLSAGAHHLLSHEKVSERTIPPNLLRVGHLPYPSMDRVRTKSSHGRALIEAGFSPDHGWQSQMLAKMEAQGELLSFWNLHSIPTAPSAESGKRPNTEVDLSFSTALKKTLDNYSRNMRGAQSAKDQRNPEIHTITLDAAVESIQSALMERDLAKVESESVALEASKQRDRAVEEITAQRDVALADRDRIQAEHVQDKRDGGNLED